MRQTACGAGICSQYSPAELCPPGTRDSHLSALQTDGVLRTPVDVQDLFEDSRRAPVSRLAPGYTVYRRPRMAEEGTPANAELV